MENNEQVDLLLSFVVVDDDDDSRAVQHSRNDWMQSEVLLSLEHTLIANVTLTASVPSFSLLLLLQSSSSLFKFQKQTLIVKINEL